MFVVAVPKFIEYGATMVSSDEFVKALQGKTGRAAARAREKENLSRMERLLKQDRGTFLKGLEEHGLKPGEPAYEAALKIYDELQ
jgi:hypothetical protein